MLKPFHVFDGIKNALTAPLVAVKRNVGSPIVQSLPLVSQYQAPNGAIAKKKMRPVDHATLESMYKSDPVVWGINRMIRTLVNQTPWDIVPDIDEELRELERWEDQASGAINDFGYAAKFQSVILPSELVDRITPEVEKIHNSGGGDPRLKRYQLETLFRIVRSELDQDARIQCIKIKRLFEQPNIHWEKSLRALQELVLHDLLTDDAGVICHNYDALGNIAELYTIPGWQVTPIVYPDRTVPQPPNAAYVWENNGQVLGYFNNSELTYIMENPQGDGFGMAPMEALMYVTLATIMGDNKFIRNLQEGDLAPLIVNLRQANKVQADTFEYSLNEKLAQTGGNKMLVVSGVPSDDGKMEVIPIPRGIDFQKTQVLEFLKLAPGIKAFAFGFQASDVQLLMDGSAAGSDEVRASLMHRRGITGRLDLLSQYYNSEIVRQEFPGLKGKFVYDTTSGAFDDPLKLEQSYSVAIANGSMTRNEARAKRKQRPFTGGDVPTITTGNQLVQVDFLEPADNQDTQDILDPAATSPVVGGSGPAVTPVAKATSSPNRNNANKRQVAEGTRITK